jgi:hypothetical protein
MQMIKPMKKSSSKSLFYVATAVFLILLAGCCSIWWHPGCAPNILTQPQSQIKKKSTPVTFTVVTHPTTNVFYQWFFNGVVIPGANSSSFTIASVDFVNVGSYRVEVWGSPTNTSDEAFLSVYDVTRTAGVTQGTLSSPVGLFTSSGTCESVSFNKFHAFFPFDGPNVTTPSPDFPNPDHLPTLTVDTFSSLNFQTDTAIQIADNWWPNTTRCCDNDSPGGTHSKQSKCGPYTMNTGANKTYRVGVFFKSGTLAPGQTNVTFNWKYE